MNRVQILVVGQHLANLFDAASVVIQQDNVNVTVVVALGQQVIVDVLMNLNIWLIQSVDFRSNRLSVRLKCTDHLAELVLLVQDIATREVAP